MKTLNEQINEVLTSKQTKSAKRNDLIKKLGLTQLDVRVLFKTYADVIEQTSTTHTRAPRITGERAATINAIAMKYTFGVEIECYNAPRESLMQALAANNLRAQNLINYCDAHKDSRLRGGGCSYGEGRLQSPQYRRCSREYVHRLTHTRRRRDHRGTILQYFRQLLLSRKRDRHLHA